MSLDEYREKLYSKIKDIQFRKKITATAIANVNGTSVSVVSNQIERITDEKGLISLEMIKTLEELSGEKILNI